jgi:DUF1680 family protein
MAIARGQLLVSLVINCVWLAPPVGAQSAGLRPVEFSAVRFNDVLWKPRLATTRTKTWPHVLSWCERTNRLRNFDAAAGRVQAPHEGYFFNDSDVYKALEGACHLLVLFPSAELRGQIDTLVSRIVAAQQPDGYLNTYFTVAKPRQRWTNDSFHELYCAGHLIEAAVAHHQATADRTLLDAALRFADHIDATFRPGRRLEAPEHPEIELALLKLWQYTGEPRYLASARFFLGQRGRPRGRAGWGEYAQDHRPLSEQREVVGHAVRATYLYSAATDLTRLAADRTYAPALEQLWNDLNRRKLYITGGIGVSTNNEGFTCGYDLPNENAYAETCASIGLALWAHRMNLLHADAEYFDVFERALYNGILSGVSLSGDRFCYVNPLASHGPATFKTSGGKQGESRSHRQEWFVCACCPPNILRFISAVGGYTYATGPGRTGEDALYVNLFAASRATVPLGGSKVTVLQETKYPWEGRVRIRLEPERPRRFTLMVRIPGWCRGATLALNGKPVQLAIDRAYAAITREWRIGDTVECNLPMKPEYIECNPLVQENQGRLALQRGPIVYCLEQADNPSGVFDLALARGGRLTAQYEADLLGGVVVLEGSAVRMSAEQSVPSSKTAQISAERPESQLQPLTAGTKQSGWTDELYRRAEIAEGTSQKRLDPAVAVPFKAIPYFAWDNRSPGEMLVWVRETEATGLSHQIGQ